MTPHHGMSPRPAGIIATAALAALMTACTGGRSGSPGAASVTSSGRSAPSSPSASGSTNQRSMVAFSRCMRSHGVSRFPDPLPDTDGSLPKLDRKRQGASMSQFQAAKRSCRHWIPGTTSTSIVGLEQCEPSGICLPAETQRLLNAGLRMARCMRHHGVPNWPDPAADSAGRVAFPISLSRDGFDPNSPQLTHPENACLTGGVEVGWAVSP